MIATCYSLSYLRSYKGTRVGASSMVGPTSVNLDKSGLTHDISKFFPIIEKFPKCSLLLLILLLLLN